MLRTSSFHADSEATGAERCFAANSTTSMELDASTSASTALSFDSTIVATAMLALTFS